jgi:hypothetical protein
MGAPCAGHEPDMNIGFGEAGALGRVAEVAHQCEVHAGAGGSAVHGGDDGLVEVFEGERNALDPLEQLGLALFRRLFEALAHLDDVAAAAKG